MRPDYGEVGGISLGTRMVIKLRANVLLFLHPSETGWPIVTSVESLTLFILFGC